MQNTVTVCSLVSGNAPTTTAKVCGISCCMLCMLQGTTPQATKRTMVMTRMLTLRTTPMRMRHMPKQLPLYLPCNPRRSLLRLLQPLLLRQRLQQVGFSQS